MGGGKGKGRKGGGGAGLVGLILKTVETGLHRKVGSWGEFQPQPMGGWGKGRTLESWACCLPWLGLPFDALVLVLTTTVHAYLHFVIGKHGFDRC